MKFTKVVSWTLFLALAGCGGGGGGGGGDGDADEGNNSGSPNIVEAINKAFPDKKLAACVYTQSSQDLLSKLPAGTVDADSFIRNELWLISCSSTSSITSVEFSDQITSLQGVSEFKNIRYVNLANNPVSDISALYGSNQLKYVDLRKTSVKCGDIYNLREWVKSSGGQMFDSCD